VTHRDVIGGATAPKIFGKKKFGGGTWLEMEFLQENREIVNPEREIREI